MLVESQTLVTNLILPNLGPIKRTQLWYFNVWMLLPDTDIVTGDVVGETFLYLAGLYCAALVSSLLASRYLVTTGELRQNRVTNIRNRNPNKMP